MKKMYMSTSRESAERSIIMKCRRFFMSAAATTVPYGSFCACMRRSFPDAAGEGYGAKEGDFTQIELVFCLFFV